MERQCTNLYAWVAGHRAAGRVDGPRLLGTQPVWVIVRIDGHTDPVGRGTFNRTLSEARAAAVRDALIARGVPAEKLRTRGFAARRPIADNHTESGRARNRRIEFHAVSDH